MISLEAYRATIGCFNPMSKDRTSFVKRCYRVFLEEIQISRLFPHSMILLQAIKMIRCHLLFALIFVLLMSGDIETKPGPVDIQKIVQGTFHQGDPKLGELVGSQCTCNALFA